MVRVSEIRADMETALRLKKVFEEYEGIDAKYATINTETRTCLVLPAIQAGRFIEGESAIGLWLTFFERKKNV